MIGCQWNQDSLEYSQQEPLFAPLILLPLKLSSHRYLVMHRIKNESSLLISSYQSSNHFEYI
jgi:hypothetical protein